MRLRLAIKIQRYIEEPWRYPFRMPKYTRPQIEASRSACRRHWRDERVPCMPSDEELAERYGLIMGVLIDAMIDNPDKADEFKDQMWTELWGKT